MAKRNFDVTNRADTSRKQKYSEIVNLEENYLMPSLQYVSMSKVARTLWHQADIKYQIVKYFDEWEQLSITFDIRPITPHRRNSYSPRDDKFLLIVHKVKENLLQLALPIHVREMLSNIVHPIGSEIFVWIKYQDDYVFRSPDFREEKSIAISYIDDLVWTPRGIIDYKETAKTLLAKGRILCELYKYNIACEYCLEDYIAIIAPKVINNTLKLISIERQTMLYFWTAHITGDFTILDYAVNFYNQENPGANYSTNECLFKVLVDNSPNEVAIKYIWDKLSHAEQSRQLVPAIRNTSNNEVRFFLLSQISKEQENEVFEYHSSKVLLHFLGDWLWGHYYLPTLQYILHIMSELDFPFVLKDIVDKMEKSHEDITKYNEYKAIFKEVWKWAPKRFKDDAFKTSHSHFGPHIFFKLFDKKNIDIIQSILFDLSDVQKKAIIFSGLGNFRWKLCFKNLITRNQLDLVEWLIESTLFCREDVERFKKSLKDKIGQEIAVHFTQNKEWNKLQQFVKWAFISDNDIRVFKLNLVYDSKICLHILKSIVENNDAGFIQLENFFEWCASGNAEKVIELKKYVLKRRVCFDTVICKLIKEDKYELLEQILNWCFVYDQKQVARFKQYFCQDYQIYETVVHLIKQDDQLQSLKKFVYYCCATDEEINKFKTCILHPTEDSEGNIVDTVVLLIQLLRKKMFKLADEFLIWCYDSSQMQINNFKNRLMIDDSINGLPLGSCDREVIRWFNPSIETMIKFKEKFRNHRSFRDILSGLDEYIQDQLKIKL